MNRFGEIADELTELIEELDRDELAADAARLRSALERAFERACEAERAQRLRLEANGPDQRTRPPARPATAQVIELGRAWRTDPQPRARRLND